MSERVKWVEHKGKEILFTDWANLRDDDKFVAAVKETSEYVISLQRYDLLELIDVTNSHKTPNVLKVMKQMSLSTKPFNKKKAVVGIAAFQRILLDAINLFAGEKIRPFEHKEEAMEWLVSD